MNALRDAQLAMLIVGNCVFGNTLHNFTVLWYGLETPANGGACLGVNIGRDFSLPY